jgi:[ribosomal protein S18]-alanine N-acetyltransferase
MKTLIPLTIRWLLPIDLVDVLRIEDWSFEYPWPRENFDKVLRDHTMQGRVAEATDGRIVGFLIGKRHPEATEIMSMAIHPDYRRRGVGRALVVDINATVKPRPRCFALVREANLEAQLFFRELGFLAISIAPQHFDWPEGGVCETAYLFERHLPQ